MVRIRLKGTRSRAGRLRSLVARFVAARCGNIAILGAVALPVVGLAAVGGVQIAYVVSVRAKTQDIADSTALMAAQQLGVEQTGAQSRAQSWAEAQLAALPAATTRQVQVDLLQNNYVQVTIKTNTPSFFGPELPVGGFPTTVSATAQGLSQTPLCVLATNARAGGDLRLVGGSTMSSTCLVYSDSDIVVDGGAALSAPATEAATTASGPISPAALTGASGVPDPFGSLSTSFPNPCGGTKWSEIDVTVDQTWPSTGLTVCADVNVSPGKTLTLGAGAQYFGYNLTLGAGSALVGSDVVLFFANNSQLNFAANSTVNLSGRQTGTYAGFVMITSRDQTSSFQIPSDAFAKVTGTIYSPSAPLIFQGSAQAAQASDWTVIVADSIKLQGSPRIVINSNYGASLVPTPSGVGPTQGASRLSN